MTLKKIVQPFCIITVALSWLICSPVVAQDNKREEYRSVATPDTGIQFSHGTWKEIQELARKENKIIFIDVYTSWCGPCKLMAAKVFPQKKVGDVFNASFINYKIDAEKGEGIELSKKYNARAFPTYLFISSEGELIYRTTSYMPAEAFIKEANIAIAEKNDPKPLARWTDEYQAGNREKDFLLGYLKKRQAIELPSAALTDELFLKLSPADLQQKETWKTIISTSVSSELYPGGSLYQYIVKNHAAVDSLKAFEAPVLYLIQFNVYNYIVRNLVPGKKLQELDKAEAAMKELAILLKDPEKEASWRKVKFNYYSKNYNAPLFNAAVNNYVTNGILKMDPKKMIADNKKDFNQWMAPYLSGKEDSTKVENWEMMKSIMYTGAAVDWSYSLRDAAEAVYIVSDNKEMLSKALAWAKKARDIFSHFSTEAVYAGLLYKNGRKAEAIRIYEQQAAKVPDIKAELFNSNAGKLKEGKLPESLWK